MKKAPMLTLASGLLLLAGHCFAQQFNYTAIDVQCSAAPPTSCANGIAKQTIASGINPAGDIVGSYVDALGQHGFLLKDGQFTTIDVPGALATNANGINPAGDIVGQYTVPVNSSVSPDSPAYCNGAFPTTCIKGFLYRQGVFATVLFPGHPGAIPQRITPDGDIYGCLHDTDTGLSMFGAVRTRFGDLSLTANGGELADPSQAVPMSMNNGATPSGHMVVGLWNDMLTNHRHGFVVQDGVFQSYDIGNILTAIWDVNPSQQFVGTYIDNAGRRHGFLQLPDGSAPINLDFPPPPKAFFPTIAFGINPDGVIVGQYSASGRVHGFVAVPATTD